MDDLPPSWAEDEPEAFDDFDEQLAEAIGLPVKWEDRECCRIDSPAPDTVVLIQEFLSEYQD
jgi:hypothetical protein